MADKEKNKSLVGWELVLPAAFIFAGVLLALSSQDVQEGRPYVFAGKLILSAALFACAIVSVFALQRVWEMRQQRWMEQEAKAEREQLNKNPTKEKTAHDELIEKYEAQLKLVKALAAVKPEKSNNAASKDLNYQEVYNLIKEDVLKLLKPEHSK